MSTFLLQFQEPARSSIKKNSSLKTMTFTREQPDEEKYSLTSSAKMHLGTLTTTSTKEERDQDASNCYYLSKPSQKLAAAMMGTNTRTDSREEQDQDSINLTYLCGTDTFTEAREENDQDISNSHLVMGTGTSTDVNREAPDNDQFHSYQAFFA